MIPVTNVILNDLGPNKIEVLRVVDSLLNCGFLKIVRSLREKPVVVATGESLEVTALVRRLQELGASVTWTAHESAAKT